MANVDPLKRDQLIQDIATGRYNLEHVLPGQVASTAAGTVLTRAQTRQVRETIKGLPMERQNLALSIVSTRADVATKIGNLKDAGFSDEQIKAMMKGYARGGGRRHSGSGGGSGGSGGGAGTVTVT
jgi:hypothetical protein